MMLLVMDIHRPRADVGREGVLGIGQGWQLEVHGWFLLRSGRIAHRSLVDRSHRYPAWNSSKTHARLPASQGPASAIGPEAQAYPARCLEATSWDTGEAGRGPGGKPSS